MKTIIEMARVAGVRDDGHRFEFSEYKYLELFAALVRADEREKVIKEFVMAGAISEDGTIVAAIRARGNT